MRKLIPTTALAAAALVGASLVAGGAAAQEKTFISIGTGGPTGVYFVVGNSVCRMVHKEAAEGRKKGRKHGIRCAAPSTGGSTYNIGQICAGELEFGVAQSDWQFHAVNGSSEKVTNCPGLRAVFSAHPEPFPPDRRGRLRHRFLHRRQGQADEHRQSRFGPARHDRGADGRSRHERGRFRGGDRADLV